MDISSVNSDLIRGNVTTIILGSLWNRDRYGYDILKEIETKSEGQYKLKQPTLYNQLKRLEKQGLISSYDGDPDDTGGGRRRYYSLTAEGRSFLEKERSEYEYSRTILDKLVSSQQFDFDKTPAPFNTDDLRPYTKKDNSDKSKVVYREKEKVVVVERKIYLDPAGNEITEEEAERLAAEGGRAVAVSPEELERLEAEKQEELKRIEAEKQAELERIEAEKQAELERIEEEKQAALVRIEEARQAQYLRLTEEAREEKERLLREHDDEIRRLREENRLAEEALQAKEAEFAALREEENARIEREREAAEERLRDGFEQLEAERRAEEERRVEAERVEAERKEALERAERERAAAEERFAAEREEFLAMKRAEDERREKEAREAREREEAIRRAEEERAAALMSQKTMSLDDVFKELDSKSEYTAAKDEGERLIVEDTEWQISGAPRDDRPTALPDEEKEEEKPIDDTPPVAFAEPAPEKEEAAEPEAEKSETVSLKEIFERLNASSEYDKKQSEEKEYIIEDAEWRVAGDVPAPEASEADKATDDAECKDEAAEEELRMGEAERAAFAEEMRRAEEARILELQRLEEERKAELRRIAQGLEEVKARLEADRAVQSEETPAVAVERGAYVSSEIWQDEVARREETASEMRKDERNFFSADGLSAGRAPEATLSDVFKLLDEKEAAIDMKHAEEERAAEEAQTEEAPAYDESADYSEHEEYAAADVAAPSYDEKGEFVTSATRPKHEGAYDYEKENVNYRDFFASIAGAQEEKAEVKTERTLPTAEPDLKTRLYAEGFKMRPYDRGNTSEYYSFNFISANRLNRDSWLIVLAVFLVEVAVMWATLAKEVSYIYFLPIAVGGAILMLIPTAVWIANPLRRKRADFNVKLSLLNRTMLMIEIAVVLVLVAFFGVGVTVNDTILILQTMVLPVILLTNLPLSSVVYYLLYRSKKYHTA